MASADRDRLDLAPEIARIDRPRAASRKRLAALTAADERKDCCVLRIAALATLVVMVAIEWLDEVFALLVCGNGLG